MRFTTGLVGLLAFFSVAVQAKTHEVTIDTLKFAPQQLEVSVGDTVSWKNKDFIPHTITADDQSFDSGKLDEGKTWKLTAKKKGRFPYHCSFHPPMTGTIVVK